MTTIPESVIVDAKNLISVLDSVKAPIVLIDKSHCIIEMNEQACRAFDVCNNDYQNKHLSNLPGGDLLIQLLNNINSARECTINDNIFAPTISETPHGWTILLTNVTHYKRLANNQSESMRYVLHDLRSPLTAILGFASMMDEVGDLNEKQKYFIEKIFSGINQMTVLVENVQDAGRYDPDSGSYQPMRVPTDIGHIVQKVVGNRLIPAEKTLSIGLSVAENIPIINADETMLQRAISNLVDNAIKYTPNNGTIKVTATFSNNQIVVAVEDNGLGISPQHQAQLFERHVRIARQEFKKIKGTGLGLFIVRSVARHHGGEAWVESDEGHGCTFFIGIPVEGQNLISSSD